jgi:hypothetical protein
MRVGFSTEGVEWGGKGGDTFVVRQRKAYPRAKALFFWDEL